MAKLDLTNQKFGRLTALRPVRLPTTNATGWRCACDCGRTVDVDTRNLRSGNTKSCGCYKIERTIQTKTTHGHAPRNGHLSPEYHSWVGMRSRCIWPAETGNAKTDYANVEICDRWRNSFENFLEDMGPKPGPQYSIDRINNSKGYNPDNCRWADRKTQNRNKRNSRHIETPWGHITVAEAAEKLGTKYTWLWHRAVKKNLPFAQIQEELTDDPTRLQQE